MKQVVDAWQEAYMLLPSFYLLVIKIQISMTVKSLQIRSVRHFVNRLNGTL